MPQMIQAICKEAALRNEYVQETIATLYFGGGTPSLLTIDSLKYMSECLRSLFTLEEDAEITLEANPDDITEEKLSAWKNAGINRLSIGVQSFFDEDLLWMNRAHTAQHAKQSILLARAAGFNNISIDLIYGIPGLSDDRWRQNIEQALQLHIPHFSCYALTVEPNTALQKMIAVQKKQDTDAETQSRQFQTLMQWMQDAGYEHYEISNFAKPGFRSKHNSSYWQGKPYLGLGPSAHSYNGISRQWNISNNALYIQSIEKNIAPFEIEILSVEEKLNEYIMTGLRTAEGISLQIISQIAGEKMSHEILKDAEKFMQQHLILHENDSLVLTTKGKSFADGIASDLFRLNAHDAVKINGALH